MRLADIELNGNAVLAPLAGYSDVGMRRVCARMGAALTYTEMISAKGLVYGSERTEDLLHTTADEKVKAVQLFGCEPYFIQAAAEHPALEKFDLIDINMGCPVPKIVKNGEGSALLKDPATAQKAVQAARKGGRPVSVKMRIGFAQGEFIGEDFAKRMEDAGACALAVHGRTREQYYGGTSDWDAIAKVVRSVKIPVFANGDVLDETDYREILRRTGAAGVMIGRGAIGNPTIFARIAGKEAEEGVKRLILLHFDTLLSFHSETYCVNTFKKHIAYYCKGMRGNRAIKLAAYECKTAAQTKDLIERSFD